MLGRRAIPLLLLCIAPLCSGTRIRSVAHNFSLYVRDIEKSMAFYSLLGFKDKQRFRIDRARAAWLSTEDSAAALELIEVPDFYLKFLGVKDGGLPADTSRAQLESPEEATAAEVENFQFGLNHFALDVTAAAKAASAEGPRMGAFLQRLNADSEERFQRSLGLVRNPRQQMFGNEVWETCVIRDPDGVNVELMALDAVLTHEMESWKTAAEVLEELQQTGAPAE